MSFIKLILDKLLCKHNWIKLESHDRVRSSDKALVGILSLYKCEKCGKFKKISIDA